MKHVFVSSTFKDMQYERDALHSFAALSINERLSPYGEEVYFSDLRWGVNTTSLDSEEGCHRVLEVCLDEIDDCRPYMIVLLGDRYGWIPKEGIIHNAALAKDADISGEMSVTELEIEYGALLSSANSDRVFFYFRNLDTTGMSDEVKCDYLAESDIHRKKIETLKEKIRKAHPKSVREYTARYDEKTGKIVGLESFLDMVISDLSGALLSDINADESLPWQERAMHSASRFYSELAKNYHPTKITPHSMLDGTFAKDKTIVQFVKGNSNVGKSAFLAYSYRKASQENDDSVLLPFVLGLDKYSTFESDYFKILLYKLEELSGDEHMDNKYGEEQLDDEVIYRILALAENTPTPVRSFIDNCSYDLQNTLSMRILDRHFSTGDLDYFGSEGYYIQGFEFMIAYSADEEVVILPPCFDYSRTYVLDDVPEDDRIPIIKMLLRQKHKELDESVISAITEKEQSVSPFYLKLAVDRMLMLDSQDFAMIRKMGDGMENINRYQIGVVNSLPDTISGMARELLDCVCCRVDREFSLRLLAILTYGAVRFTESEFERIYLTQGWNFSSLEFALATRSLSSMLNYNPKDKSYRIVNPDVISALEKMLYDEGYSYVAKGLITHIESEGKYHSLTMESALFHAVSYACAENVSDIYERYISNQKFLSQETAWLIRRHGSSLTSNILVNIVLNNPQCDFSFIIREIPTACLTIDDRDYYETILQTIVDKIEIKSSGDENINRNSFAALAWSKLVNMRMKVNASDASPIFHEFVNSGKFDCPVTTLTRIMLDTVYYRFLALEAFHSMELITPESEMPRSIDLLDEIDSPSEKLILSSNLFGSFSAYLNRAFVDPSQKQWLCSIAKRGCNALFEELSSGALSDACADDIALMIDTMLDDKDDMLRVNSQSVAMALKAMAAGQTYINSRLLKYLPRILSGAKYSLDNDENAFSPETVNILRRLCATSRAVSGASITIDDFLYATVQMEHSYDIISEHIDAEEHYTLINHLYKLVKMIINASEDDPRTFYRCYMSLHKLFSIFDIYELDEARMELLDFVSRLEIEDVDAPILPELLIGSLIYKNGCPDNDELRDHLRELLEVVDNDPKYELYKSSYSPELMYLKIDIRTPEEIAQDDEYLFSHGFCFNFDAENEDEEDDDEYVLDD